MVKRKAIEAVEMELQERTFDNNRVILAYEIYNGVAEAFATRREKRFFVEMATPGTWVFTEHVDECFRGLLELKKAYPYIFRGDVAMMDSCFSMIVQGAFIEGGPTNVPETILVYTRGEIDDWPSTPWDKAAFILVPYCFNGHWVLARIVPEAKKLVILDSDHSVDSNCKIILQEVTPLARMMPHILVAMGVQTDTDTQWTIVRPKDFPKQSLSGECGVYAIAAATFTLADRDAYTINDAIVSDFRKVFYLLFVGSIVVVGLRVCELVVVVLHVIAFIFCY
ncbi:sentrin-specific protease 1-like [Dorcoceras hygrometricum]|uniref:Sentrin-specific protease 1-like n=1 Tax=Dorcoceras hygrometricum TaxID=472368 RepID=A0A2Z7ABY9_9LAMI|nr:sentrin-specific protease 1-like [Dorcoceras hygrometricum]